MKLTKGKWTIYRRWTILKLRSTLIWLALPALLLAACGRSAGVQESPAMSSAPAAATLPAAATPAPLPSPSSSVATPAATRVGADYVLLLPREAAVPAGWVMNPTPAYESRRPQPGDTYRFGCLDLTARSVGVATVGYRNLEGLPNVHIEYVIYPTAEDAAAALADMQRATVECPTFTIGEGDGATAAAFGPLDFPPYGDAGIASTLHTESDLTGSLLTHMIKIRRGHVIIGIHHANYAGEPPPDRALTESLAALAVGNLADGPAAPGRE